MRSSAIRCAVARYRHGNRVLQKGARILRCASRCGAIRRDTARYGVIRRDIVAIRRDTSRYRRETTRYGAISSRYDAIRRDTAHLICQISRWIEMACIALRRDTARLTTDYRQIAFRIVKSRFVLRKRNVMKSGAIRGTVISRYGGYLTARCTVQSVFCRSSDYYCKLKC